MDPIQSRQGAHSLMSRLDALLFAFAGVAALWLAFLLLAESLQLSAQLVLLVVFWLLVAYLVLPRLHRMLTYVYVPGYFIGRTRTSDGLLGDSVNLALLGTEGQLHAAMTAAGWTRADEVTFASSRRIATATLTRRPYPEAPVSPLFLFDRRQDFAYQQEVSGNPSQRHHVRFWQCPEGWKLPGGYRVDWLAAGTYDRSVGLSLWTFQITHRIARHIDRERDHIIATLVEGHPQVSVDRIADFASGYHARNGGGDQMVTDGDLPVVDLRSVAAAHVVPSTIAETPTGPPAPTLFSAAVAILRGLVGLFLVWSLLANGPDVTSRFGLHPSAADAGAAVLAVVAVADLGLGVATYLGRNWARVLLMLTAAGTTLVALVAAATGGPRPSLGTSLPHVALGILVLLALTSPAARDYAEQRAAEPGPSPSEASAPEGYPARP